MRIRGTWTVLGCLGLLCLSRLAAAGDALLPRPPELEPDVEFWIRVYTEISTNDGFLHDQRDLSKVYETLHFGPELPVHERAHRVEAERTRLQEILRHLATGAAPADAEEQKVRDLWGAEATRGQLAEAVDDVRFQLGQSDRFREGLIRAGAWQAHIAQVLARLGLPPEIAALPHVESSFDPAAHSKVGAAGLWQFMRSTGRRFLRIDSAVDERLDPFRETEAAAQLLSYDYRLLGSWPLAITAYNHGAEGMLRAREALDTDDIVRIVRDYHSPTFGFASRNFYVSFLAALSISEDPEKYFGALHRGAARSFVEVKLAASAPGSAVLKALAIDPDTLRELNPALRPAVWSGRRPIPAGYVIRLPGSDAQWTPALLAQRLEAARPREAARPAMVAAASPGPALSSVKLTVSAAPAVDIAADAAHAGAAAAQYYLVQGDDTVSSIAERTGVTVAKLMALNSIPGPDYIYGGERLRLAAGVPGVETANSPEAQDLAQQAVQEKEDEDRAVAAARGAGGPGPLSAAQAQAEGPQLAPGVPEPQTADPVDYSVAADDSIRVVAAETLGHYADWLGTSAARLRALNHLRARNPVVMGRRIRLDFERVSRTEFEQRRREYHQQLQAAYFASHRIAGAETYIARRGDSLWSITRYREQVPIWLLQQYNPELDFGDLRPGTQISLPKVEDVSGL